jgi:hypothetical protein
MKNPGVQWSQEKSMNDFSAWAAILGDLGDFIGSIAVLITLIYLALQVKHGQAMLEENRKISLAQTYQTRAQMAAGMYAFDPLALTPKLQTLDLYKVTVDDLAELDERELAFLKYFYYKLVLALDNGFYQSRLGLIESQMAESGKIALINLLPVFNALGVGVLPEAQKVLTEHAV